MGKKARLYYIGGLEVKPTEDGKRRPRPFIVGATTFVLPEPGKFIEIDEWAAKEAVAKFKMNDFNPFTLNPVHAERMMKGLPVGDARNLHDYSEAELEAMLEEKRSKNKTQPSVESLNPQAFDEMIDLSGLEMEDK